MLPSAGSPHDLNRNAQTVNNPRRWVDGNGHTEVVVGDALPGFVLGLGRDHWRNVVHWVTRRQV